MKIIMTGNYRLIIANSKLMKKDLIQRFGISPENITVVNIFFQSFFIEG